MSIDSQILPPEPSWPTALPAVLPRRAKTIPHLGHTLLFLAIILSCVLTMQLLALWLAKGLHLFPHETSDQLMRDPRLLIPTMFLSYLVGGLFSIVIFSTLWRRPFAEGVRWDLAPIAKHRWLLIGTGIAVSIVVQLLSNFLPIPKELPIDDFFRNPLDIWMVAVFGIFVAPLFEELAFRGFLLPSLASAWDWSLNRFTKKTDPLGIETTPLEAFAPLADPRWSPGAVVFASTLTSICFALMHADQLAHAYAPLTVLFCVSLVLCAVRLRWHSLAASALVHACYNGTIFAMLFIATDGFRHLDKLKQ